MGIYQKNQHIRFLVHGHSSWFTFGLHLVRGAKSLDIDFLEKLDHESWTMKSDDRKRPSTMIRLHGPWCKPTFRRIDLN
jgi:hypothetical protein